ncbi:MAG TPA: translation initiation factor IF-2 [Chthoniobacterales bacterium]|jgi:translation initiation factor IF-2
MATRANPKNSSPTKSSGKPPLGKKHEVKPAPAAPEKPAAPTPPPVPVVAEDLISPRKKKVIAAGAIKPTVRIGAAPVAPPQPAAPAPVEAPAPKPQAVSLIDAKPAKGAASGDKTFKSPFAPISRIVGANTPAAAPVPTPAPVAAAAAPEEESDPTVSDSGELIIHIKPPIIVKELATQLKLRPFEVIKDLMAMGIFANINQTIEPDIAGAVCKLHGAIFEVEKREKGGGVHKVEPVVVAPPAPIEVKEDELVSRPPVITFMGHVDHGKTSLMDAIRKTRVTAGEAGGITQHIGAYSVERNGHKITFLDTPGHAAFTQMRARGANLTDIVVLVVAADDGLMPQTIEAINHAKAAKVKIVVAINKIDLPSANVDRVKTQLQEKGLQPEDWGGDTICVPVSATKGKGIDELLELMLLEAEVLELRADASSAARGTVIESQVETGRGPTATILVQVGTLKLGDPFICGNFSGKVKAMTTDTGASVKTAGPSTPVKVLGFTGVPASGDEFLVMDSEKAAKALGEERLHSVRQTKLAAPARATLENLFDAMADEQHKLLEVILKCDVHGSLEAVSASLNDIKSKKINLRIIHSGVGPITESDVLLGTASNAVIIGFNVKVENTAANSARRENVQIKLFSIIYELIDQVKEAMVGLLDPETRESIVGHAEVKQVFDLTRGTVAGCIVTDGRIVRTGRARVLRRKQAVFDGSMSTLRRFQDEVKEVRNGLECGIKLANYDEYQEGDIIECYTLEKFTQKL